MPPPRSMNYDLTGGKLEAFIRVIFEINVELIRAVVADRQRNTIRAS